MVWLLFFRVLSMQNPWGGAAKIFPLDKNYVLEQVQLLLQDDLLRYLVDFVKVEYLLHHNSLGLVDETVQRIRQHQPDNLGPLCEFYITLAGIFRYRYYHSNQLSFIFSGEEPDAVYRREWTTAFKSNLHIYHSPPLEVRR